MRDVDKIVEIFDSLIVSGSSVIIIEHNLEVISHADHIIDIGPEAGQGGGQIVFEGPPHAQKYRTLNTVNGSGILSGPAMPFF